MKLPDKAELEEIGLISKLYGKDGGVLLHLFAEDDELLNKTDYLFVDIHGQVVPFFLIHDKIEPKSGKRFAVHFEDITNEEHAIDLLNRRVYLPANKTFSSVYQEALQSTADITGFDVVDAQSGKLGIIETLQEDKMQYTLVVKHKDESILIPLVHDFIRMLDEENQILYMNLPEGLIDINR